MWLARRCGRPAGMPVRVLLARCGEKCGNARYETGPEFDFVQSGLRTTPGMACIHVFI